ncbi:MAG: acyltransferase [Chloroflexota bacterium]
MQIRKLNSLRGIAALIVVVSHYSNLTNVFSGLLGGGAGEIGVMLFFVLSGFLMAYLYLDREFEKSAVGKFSNARIARVVPLFTGVVIVSFLLGRIGLPLLYDISTIPTLLANLFFISGVSVLWTIPTEVQFYLLFVILWRLYSRKKGILFAVMAIIFVALALLGFPESGVKFYGVHIRDTIVSSLQFFFAGILFGWLYRVWRPPARLQKNAYALALLLILLIYPNIFKLIFGFEHDAWKDLSVLAVVSSVFFVIAFLVPDDNKFLSNRLGDFLGSISYSVYVFHFPVLGWMSGYAARQPLLFFPVYVALILGLSALSYRFFEKPAREAIRSLGLKREAAGERNPALNGKV